MLGMPFLRAFYTVYDVEASAFTGPLQVFIAVRCPLLTPFRVFHSSLDLRPKELALPRRSISQSRPIYACTWSSLSKRTCPGHQRLCRREACVLTAERQQPAGEGARGVRVRRRVSRIPKHPAGWLYRFHAAPQKPVERLAVALCFLCCRPRDGCPTIKTQRSKLEGADVSGPQRTRLLKSPRARDLRCCTAIRPRSASCHHVICLATSIPPAVWHNWTSKSRGKTSNLKRR